MTATDCAKAVETFLNAQEFTQDIVVERKDRAYFDRKRMKAADPWAAKIKKGPLDAELESRANFRDTYVIEVGLGKVVDAEDQDAVDEATDFVEEVVKKFSPGRLGAGGTLIAIGAGSGFPPQTGQADDLADVFVGVISLTFLVTR
jgi:hypothetical protein